MDPSRDELIAQVCHELRTPLTPIKGFLHTLLRRDDELDPEERQRIYEVLLREEQRLEDLVRDLLHATTLDHQELEPAPEAVDWPTVVAEQVDLYRRSDLSRDDHRPTVAPRGRHASSPTPTSPPACSPTCCPTPSSTRPTGTPIAVRGTRRTAARWSRR